MKQLTKGSKVGITACSNGYDREYETKLNLLCDKLRGLGFVPVISKCIYRKESAGAGTGKERAKALMEFFESQDIQAIFDISGGNVANEVIAWLDYKIIAKNPKPMFGYSDLTCVLNAIFTKTGVTTYLYQIRNLMYSNGAMQEEWIRESLMKGGNELFSFPVDWIQESFMQGVAIGGNIRCFLKLAGTPYFPEMKDRILVLEGCSGKPDLLISLLTQLKLMGAFDQVSGILLGTFTEMEENGYQPRVEQIVTEVVGNPNLPIAKTKWIGHGVTSKCVRIGEMLTLS